MAFSLFKKKIPDINSVPDVWTNAKSEMNGKPLFIRFKSGLKEVSGHLDFPFQIGVAIPLLSSNKHGLPEAEEFPELERIEKEIVESLESTGKIVFSNVITHNGMREFVFYAKEWTPEAFEKKVKSIKSEHKPQFMMQKDPAWKTYKTFSS